MRTREDAVLELIQDGVNDPENIATELDMDIDDVYGYIASLEEEGRVTQERGYLEAVGDETD